MMPPAAAGNSPVASASVQAPGDRWADMGADDTGVPGMLDRYPESAAEDDLPDFEEDDGGAAGPRPQMDSTVDPSTRVGADTAGAGAGGFSTPTSDGPGADTLPAVELTGPGAASTFQSVAAAFRLPDTDEATEVLSNTGVSGSSVPAGWSHAAVLPEVKVEQPAPGTPLGSAPAVAPPEALGVASAAPMPGGVSASAGASFPGDGAAEQADAAMSDQSGKRAAATDEAPPAKKPQPQASTIAAPSVNVQSMQNLQGHQSANMQFASAALAPGSAGPHLWSLGSAI